MRARQLLVAGIGARGACGIDGFPCFYGEFVELHGCLQGQKTKSKKKTNPAATTERRVRAAQRPKDGTHNLIGDNSGQQEGIKREPSEPSHLALELAFFGLF